jgi:two-component system, sensor histidine kinase RegB
VTTATVCHTQLPTPNGSIHPMTITPTSSLHHNLFRLQRIRLVVFVLQVVALLYAYFGMGLPLNYTGIISVLSVLALINGALFWRLRSAHYPNTNEFMLHLAVDIAGLGLLLYFCGGATNPFVSYLLVPITIAAVGLHWRQVLGLASLALLCYSLLLFFYEPLPALLPAASTAPEHIGHDMSAMPNTSAANSGLTLHIIGMWFNFAVSGALIIYFIVQMATELRQHEDKLRQYREDTLRNEQVLALATQAAGTAHELGTPLSTMAVLIKELQYDYPGDGELQQNLHTLHSQLQLCRTSLRNLVQRADFQQVQSRTQSLQSFSQQLLEHWQLLRPEVPCEVAALNLSSASIVVDATLEQALINLLNNAADASAEQGIAVSFHCSSSHWQLHVRDYGAGVPLAIQQQLGTTITSNKPHGMGVGLVLSQATLSRLGGSVQLFPQTPSGTLTVIELPLPKQNAVS